MRKITTYLLAMAVFMCAAATASAQDVRWQIRAGLGISNLYSTDASIYDDGFFNSPDPRLSLNVGVAADIPLSKNGMWRLQPELRYTMKGFGNSHNFWYEDHDAYKDDYTTRLHYLELVMAGAARMRMGRRCYVSVRVGPYVSFGLDANTHLDYMDRTYGNHFTESTIIESASQRQSSTYIPKFHRWEFGFVEGVDFHIRRFIVGLEFSEGFTPLYATHRHTFADETYRCRRSNFTAALTFGVQF